MLSQQTNWQESQLSLLNTPKLRKHQESDQTDIVPATITLFLDKHVVVFQVEMDWFRLMRIYEEVLNHTFRDTALLLCQDVIDTVLTSVGLTSRS